MKSFDLAVGLGRYARVRLCLMPSAAHTSRQACERDAGYPIQRIADYDAWSQRFETAMRAPPEQQRQHSLLPILHAYQQPEKPNRGSVWPADRLCSAVQEAKIGPDKDLPHISAPIIVKYITNLQLLGLL